MSFTLIALAVYASADDDQVRARAEQCWGPDHPEGEPDSRVVAFYEELRALYPDDPSNPDPESPWMSEPLSVGIDHVSADVSYSSREDAAVQAILRLAQRHGLVVYDPQGDQITRPEEGAVAD